MLPPTVVFTSEQKVHPRTLQNMCLHCLEEGDWTDEDKCPDCASKGHTSPWRAGSCAACNKDFYDKMDMLLQRVGGRSIPECVRRTP